MIRFLRCLFFDICYFLWTAIFSLGMLWSFILPLKQFNFCVRQYFHFVHFLERIILNLNLEIKGLDNLPERGAYIIASKHQSTYETLKFFKLIKGLVIILKKELKAVPVWGWYPQKMRWIFLDRGRASVAMKSMLDGVKHAVENERPVLIFPQGTRVSVDASTKDMPYKSGIAKIYAHANVPVVPVALNAGYFWPKNSFWKKSGTVTMEFLPAIQPGLPQKEFMTQLEAAIESRSKELLAQGKNS